MNRLLPAVLALLLVWPLLIHAEAAPPSTRPAFTAEQQQWLEEHRQLRVGLLMQAPQERVMTAEQDRPLAEARGEITYAASFIKWFVEEAKRAYGDLIPGHAADKHILV